MLDFVTYYVLSGLAILAFCFIFNPGILIKIYREDGLFIVLQVMLVIVVFYPYLFYRVLSKDSA